MNKRLNFLSDFDTLIAFVSVIIICANIVYVIANTLEIPLSQIVNSAVICSGIVALIVLALAAITRVLDLKKDNIATYTAKLEN
jgi:asparagine N-glycosylation enzyme membrane subunit Stt3